MNKKKSVPHSVSAAAGTSRPLPFGNKSTAPPEWRNAAGSDNLQNIAMFNLACLKFADDFDEFVARADSGGSTYGLLKRHAYAQSSLRVRPTTSGLLPEETSFALTHRQRSKSLAPPSVLADEKSLIKVLCEQGSGSGGSRSTAAAAAGGSTLTSGCNTLQLQAGDYRRHSSGAVCYFGKNADDEKWKRSNCDPLQVPPSLDHPDIQRQQQQQQQHPDQDEDGGACSEERRNSGYPVVCRRRSFSVTPRGLVNEGDEMVPFLQSLNDGTLGPSSQQTETGTGDLPGFFLQAAPYLDSRRSSYEGSGQGSGGSSVDTSVHRILMLGGPGVGKTALTQQFITSEFMAAQNTSFDDGREISVPVLLDGEESIMEFIDLPYSGELDVWREYDVDAYIIVYSITDRRSYQKAVDVMNGIRESALECTKPVILVANKSDLERSRMIGKEEGKALAQANDGKYIEVSAILNHKVDDLLVGMLKQIRLSQERQRKASKKRRQSNVDEAAMMSDTKGSGSGSCIRNSPGMFAKLLGATRKMSSKSCENLLTS